MNEKRTVSNLNILHLRYAVEVAKTGSINKAAENLLMGQPNLSRAIKELESSLGIHIFDRSAKGMVVTTEGEEFLGYAKKILAQIEEVEALYNGSCAKKQRFSISVPRASYIADAFARFTNHIGSAPAEIFYKETNSLRAIKNILTADYKLGILRYALAHDKYFKDMLAEKGLGYEMIAEFKYQLIMRSDNPLAKKESVSFSDLADYIEIAHADPYVPSLSQAEVKREEIHDNTDKKIFVFERASQYELLSENINTFMWVSPVHDKLLERYGLVRKSCPDNNKVYKDVLIYHKDYRMSELDNLFITELCSSKREFFKGIS